MTPHPSAVIHRHRHRARMSKLITIFGAGQGLGERLTVPVARTYPIAEVPAALAGFTVAPLGKIAITVA